MALMIRCAAAIRESASVASICLPLWALTLFWKACNWLIPAVKLPRSKEAALASRVAINGRRLANDRESAVSNHNSGMLLTVSVGG